MKEKTKKRILIAIAVVVALIFLRFFVVWFVGLFDNLKRHGIEGPGTKNEAPVKPGR